MLGKDSFVSVGCSQWPLCDEGMGQDLPWEQACQVPCRRLCSIYTRSWPGARSFRKGTRHSIQTFLSLSWWPQGQSGKCRVQWRIYSLRSWGHPQGSLIDSNLSIVCLAIYVFSSWWTIVITSKAYVDLLSNCGFVRLIRCLALLCRRIMNTFLCTSG